MRAALLLLGLLASPALAEPVCTFTQECYMTLECEETDWQVEVDLDKGVLSTIVEDYEIVDVEENVNTQIAARGMGGLALLTIGPATSVFTTHIGAGPAAITYYGECE